MGAHWVLKVNHRPAYLLKRVRSDSVHARHVWRSLNFLSQMGVSPKPTWMETAAGEPFLEWSGGQWMLVPWLNGTPAPVYTEEGFPKLLRLLSQIHRLGADCPHGESFLPVIAYGRRLSDLEDVANVEAQTAFIQQYQRLLPYYAETAHQALVLLKGLIAEEGFRATVCHGDPSSKNVLWMGDGRWVLLDWDRLVRAPRWWELAQAIRRFRNQHAWKSWPLWECLDRHVQPVLEPHEKMAVLGSLLFPQEFWRLGDQYLHEQLHRPESWFLKRLQNLQRLESRKKLTLLEWARPYAI